MTADYLLGLTDNLTERLTPVEKLHLTDDAVQVLKDGKINTHLLSRIITHPSFQHFMIDAEIYVDRIAESRIQSMNAYLESIRQTFVKNTKAEADDLWMRSLEAGQVDEDEYYGHVITKDQLKIPYDKFTPEEFAAFIKVMESSPALKQAVNKSMRGKSKGSHGPRKGRGPSRFE